MKPTRDLLNRKRGRIVQGRLLRAVHWAKAAPRVRALTSEVLQVPAGVFPAHSLPRRSSALGQVTRPAAGEIVPHGQVAPGVYGPSGQLRMVLPAEELIQEPVDGAGLIAKLSEPERHARDQRPNRPPGVELCSDAAQQIIDPGRVITAAALEP
jgi:hypothetical protein